MIAFLAAYLAERLPALAGGKANSRRRPPLVPLLAPTLILTGLALLLLIFQRDLGTASIFLFLYTMIVFIAVRQVRILLAGGLVLLLAAIAGYALFDVVRLRVDAWLNPWADPSGRSYQIVQSLLAVANGGILGRGPGLGNPALVPVPHSDFIFTAIVEESGLVGGLALIVLDCPAGRARHPQRHARRQHVPFLPGCRAHRLPGRPERADHRRQPAPAAAHRGHAALRLLRRHVPAHLADRPAHSSCMISSQSHRAPARSPRLSPYSTCSWRVCSSPGWLAPPWSLGWWSFYRAPALLTRTDNPRRAIADRAVPRGAILARDGQPLTVTSGEPGEYTRQYLYPPLSPLLGYTDPTYGQSGLEASMDAYLRGVQGYPALTIWWSHLLYGQPPPGLDLRLSLDLDLQRLADEALGEHPGALVLLDAASGEILAMASHPGFDANQLAADWEQIIANPGSPLLDRATLGRYPAADLVTKLLPQGISAQQPDPTGVLARWRRPRSRRVQPAAGSPAGSRHQQRRRAARPQPGAGSRKSAGRLDGSPAAARSRSGYTRHRRLKRSAPPCIRPAPSCGGLPAWTPAPRATGDLVRRWHAAGFWTGRRLALAVLLEEDDPELAEDDRSIRAAGC